MARSYPGQPANPPYPPPPAPEVNPAGPPPAPSSRQVHADYVEPLPSFENTPIDMVAETVEAIPDEEPNPFQKPSRFERLRKLLRRPSREMSIRAGLAAAALLVGWGAGAKPWKSDPPRAAVTAKASTKAAAAKAAAAKASKPAARPPAAAKAEAPRRVAVIAHDSTPVLAKSRTETKAALAPKAKVTTAKASTAKVTTKSATAKATAAKAAKSKAKAATKVTAKKQATKAATAKASFKAKAKANPKATAKKAASTQG